MASETDDDCEKRSGKRKSRNRIRRKKKTRSQYANNDNFSSKPTNNFFIYYSESQVTTTVIQIEIVDEKEKVNRRRNLDLRKTEKRKTKNPRKEENDLQHQMTVAPRSIAAQMVV